MICPDCGFKNATGAKFCGKCNKTLKHLCLGHGKIENFSGYETKFRKHRKFVAFENRKFSMPQKFKEFLREFSSEFNYLSSTKLKNHASVILKALILLIAIIGISGVASAHPISGNSGSVQNGTVYIENGFSGVVAIKDPLLHKTVNVKVNYHPYSTGSGSIVTKNGYIITAFHVICDSKTLENKNALKKMNPSDVKWYVDKLGLTEYMQKNPNLYLKLLPNTSNQDPDKTVGLATDKFIKNGWISTKSCKLSIKVKGLGLNGINSKNSLDAHLVDVGDSKKDQDIALLKVDSKDKNLPALDVSSKDPKIGENISVYGYPGEKMEARQNKPGKTKQSAAGSEDYTPFISSGHLTAKQPNPQGTVYYKTAAITAEGYSGGPVVNINNKLTGVLVYGIYDADKITKKQKTVASLFLSSKYIKEICSKNKVPITVA